MSVAGPVPSENLGITLPHEHLLCNLYRVTGEPNHLLNEVALAIEEVRKFVAVGGRTIIDVTSLQLGRDPVALRDIAEATGVQIVMGCGWYRESYFDRAVYEQTTRELAAVIERDLTHGVDETGIRAGIIGEIGTDKGYVSPAEERVFRAAALAHLRTGASITTHAARSSVGLEQLELLADSGVDLHRVIVGHCDTVPDSSYHEAIARKGAYVQFDTIRGNAEWDTQNRLAWVSNLARQGFLHQILLSHDVCMRSHLTAYGGNGYAYVSTEFVARLRGKGLSEEEVATLLVANPRAALTGTAG